MIDALVRMEKSMTSIQRTVEKGRLGVRVTNIDEISHRVSAD